MAFARKYNRSTPVFNVRVSNPAYTTLKDLYVENGSEHVYPIAAIYMNTKGQYGPQGVIAMNEHLLVNLPMHLNEQIEEMRKDAEAIEAINNGQAGFQIYEYTTKKGRVCYSVTWVDLTE